MWFVLLFASAGVVEHAGIKIPFFAFFAHDQGIGRKYDVKEAPKNMLAAMAIALSISAPAHAAPGDSSPDGVFRELPSSPPLAAAAGQGQSPLASHRTFRIDNGLMHSTPCLQCADGEIGSYTVVPVQNRPSQPQGRKYRIALRLIRRLQDRECTQSIQSIVVGIEQKPRHGVAFEVVDERVELIDGCPRDRHVPIVGGNRIRRPGPWPLDTLR